MYSLSYAFLPMHFSMHSSFLFCFSNAMFQVVLEAALHQYFMFSDAFVVFAYHLDRTIMNYIYIVICCYYKLLDSDTL